jgi:carbamoyltransferase
MKVLGISAYYHDSAAAITQDGVVVAAAQEERFSRQKQDPRFPAQACRYCLQEAGLNLNDLDAVVFYDKPLLKFERLLETQYRVAPGALGLFVSSMPIWLKEKLFLKRVIREQLRMIDKEIDFNKVKLLFTEHHLAHAASAYYPSPFEEAAVLTVDGVGEWATASMCHAKGSEMEVLKEMHFPNSVGLLYSAFTWFLGFRVNSGEYKLMGLAPYGNPASPSFERYKKLIREHLVDIKEDGSIHLNPQYFRYSQENRLIREEQWEHLFGMKRRRSDEPFMLRHANLAMAIQRITELIVIKMARHIKTLTQSENLCLAGGVALNSVLNGKLENAGIFKNIWVQPAAGDAGCALGAALAGEYLYFKQARELNGKDQMKGSCLGPEYDRRAILDMIEAQGADFEELSEPEMLARTTEALSEGKIVGWFQGRMEFGPRALGSRSILADPRGEATQRKLNVKVKFRESFRPFAPAILEEDAEKYFEGEDPSPYMLFVRPLKDAWRNAVPWNYETFTVKEKLYSPRSDFQAITHVDFSARLQTVNEEQFPTFHKLLKAFKASTGCPILVNTSFNLRGRPIVCTPEDAYWTFMQSEMDVLVVGNFLFDKTLQKKWAPSPLYLN